MADLCEGGGESPDSLKAICNVNGIGDSKMAFSEMGHRTHHRLPDIRLTVGKNHGKTQSGNQPKRDSNPRPSATSDREAEASAD
ncbi:hypothetical protein ANN_15879 [Periplaneta americana]|uniref:Uncharacterized protein n=1 Tax=Periplaneta americana TaxID=6978 RepID=A0ABQ8SHG0_PERAM|nr:hypothetical protein ANN_15879 [Periplaneta americana]